MKLANPQAPCLNGHARQIMAAFAEENLHVMEIRNVQGGMWMEFDDLTISVTTPPDRPGELRIIAAGKDDGSPGSRQARERFHACAILVRHISQQCMLRRTEWRHRGGFYITEGGRIAIVNGMRGTSGQGQRRSTTDRAFSLYGPNPSDIEAANTNRKSQSKFTIGGKARRTLPDKLSEAAVNAIVCVISLPSGAALVTYSLLRGGSVEQSARWVAMTGLAAGISSPHIMFALLN